MSNGFEMTQGCVNDDSIFIFGWTVPSSLLSAKDQQKHIHLTAQLSEDDEIWEPLVPLFSYAHF